MEIKIYTFATCIYCSRAKMLLEKLNLPYEELVIDKEKLRDLSLQTNMHTVPQIFFDDKLIGGCSELEGLIVSKEIEEYL